MAKDLGYARQEAARLKMDLATAAAALSLYEKSLAAGNGDKDVSAVVEQFRQS
jgi:3-hydroxyisobutyrate dehydrogenase-like beta-hydroxyacid dehydrogenase